MLQAFSLSFPILFSFISSLFSVSTADSNVYVQCSQLNFTSTTPYESNLNSLFTSLIDSASVYNFNKFETSPQSDTVYGLFQCRGDVTSKNCNNCVANSINQLKTTCPMSTGGEIQLEGCFVKYDDSSFFGVEDKMEVCKQCGPSTGYNSDVLNHIDSALTYLIGGNREYFRQGDFGSVQGVAQCVQDLSLSDCQDCLAEASGRLRSECGTSTWGDMYLGKCYIRYADQDNENPVNNGNSTNKSSSGGSKEDIAKWIGYILAAFFGGGSFSIVVKITINKKARARKLKKEKQELEEKKNKLEIEVVKVKKEADDAKKKEGSAIYIPYGPSLPPPCPYMPYPNANPNPDSCYYL